MPSRMGSVVNPPFPQEHELGPPSGGPLFFGPGKEALLERETRVGISSCLLGDTVRYDGGHKRNDFLADRLGPRVVFVPFCPEIAIGLGVPRPPVRLLRGGNGIRLVDVQDGRIDHTPALRAFAEAAAERLAAAGVSGVIFKSRSPSCALFDAEIGPAPATFGPGLFASILAARLPDIPMEDEARLEDPGIREDFLRRLFACRPRPRVR